MERTTVGGTPPCGVSPPVPQAPHLRRLTLESNREVAPSVYVLTWSLPDDDPLYFVPGQYVTFYLRREGRSITRSYSIFSSAKHHDRLSLLIKKVPQGFGSHYLTGLDPLRRPTLNVLAPLGRFVLHDPQERTVVLVGTGVGVAPFVPMLERLRDVRPGASVWLIHGARYADDLVDRAPFEVLARVWPTFHFVPVLSRPPEDGSWTGGVGHVEERVRALLPDLSGADVYLCGANRMINEMQELAVALHAPKDRVFVDRWGDHPE
jgi:CDP-4-dehydro-6-deoxyglucose reductase